MLTILMPSEIIKGKVTSCCFLGQTIGSARGLCGAALDWVGFCATIIERRRDAASAGSVFWPYEKVALHLLRRDRPQAIRAHLPAIFQSPPRTLFEASHWQLESGIHHVLIFRGIHS